MTLFTLILRNLKYYRKPYLSILAGTVVSTAVLTGALVVGDSVRYSLGHLTDIRLGKTHYAVQARDRFFRQQLASELEKQTKSPVASVLQLEGIALNTDKNTQINLVEVLGVDDSFMRLWDTSLKQPGDDEAILSRNAAEKLDLKPGDEFLLKIRKQAKASENAPFVSEKEPLVVFRLKVTAIADDQQMGRFSLKSNQSAPFNIFISLSGMALKADLTGNANLLLIANNNNVELNIHILDSFIQDSWQPEDAGLEFRKLSAAGSYEILSSRIFIDDNTAKGIKTSIPGAEAVFTYLVNDIRIKEKSTPYSFITAEDTSLLKQPLSEHEIIISDWLASDLSAKPGDSLTLTYYKMGSLRKLTEDSTRFCIKMILPITNPIFDRSLMPDFPGMSDAGNCREWETGTLVDLNKIRDKDELYWNTYRGTPKAFISIAAGQKIWSNAFGNTTAFRFKTDSSNMQVIQSNLMKQLNPAEYGLSVRDVYSEGKSAAANSTDFGGLFLSLSFFIIAAALLLIALLFSLHAQQRMAETAVMNTLGFRKKVIIRVLFTEAALMVIAGNLLGAVCGIVYNKFILLALNTLWRDAVNTSMLQTHVIPGTLLIGFAAGVITSLVTLFIVLLQNLRKPLAVMVKGVEIHSPSGNRIQKIISLSVAFVFSGFSFALITYSIILKGAIDATPFLSAGGLILVAGIAFLYAGLIHSTSRTTNSLPGFFTLIFRNMSLNKRRTITAVALLAIGTFSVIITGANRKTFYGTENSHNSGTGGFLFWAESTVPVLYDLNSPEGKQKYGLADETDLQNVHFSQMYRLDGNDASCLNLNQVAQPAILGVNPGYFDQQGSFSFLTLEPSVNQQHPWLDLEKTLAPGIIAGFADQTVIQWGLIKKVGDTLNYLDEGGNSLKVVLMGGLDNSIFQGNILVSASLFRKHFPSVAGSRVMLIDGNFSNRTKISERIEYLFQDYGMVVTSTSGRLAEFNSVTNTYLTVFMLLGGLGIIIGTIGLGIVLLRNLAERKQEIALYQSLGFRKSNILKLILTENLFILFTGMGIGIIAAFAGILPSILSSAFRFPIAYLIVIVLLIFLSGLAWIYFPIKSSLRKNLVQALRNE